MKAKIKLTPENINELRGWGYKVQFGKLGKWKKDKFGLYTNEMPVKIFTPDGKPVKVKMKRMVHARIVGIS